LELFVGGVFFVGERAVTFFLDDFFGEIVVDNEFLGAFVEVNIIAFADTDATLLLEAVVVVVDVLANVLVGALVGVLVGVEVELLVEEVGLLEEELVRLLVGVLVALVVVCPEVKGVFVGETNKEEDFVGVVDA